MRKFPCLNKKLGRLQTKVAGNWATYCKPFVIFMDALFQVDAYFEKKGLVVYFLCSGMKIVFLFSTGIKQQSSALFWTYRNS